MDIVKVERPGAPETLERFRFDWNHSRIFSLTAANLTVRACADAPDNRRAAVAASSDSTRS